MDQNRNRSENKDLPNRASNMEQAEGSRENVRSSGDKERGGSRNSGGISNRDLDRERSEQRDLPERGRSQPNRDRSQSER